MKQYLYLVVSNQSFKLFLQPCNTRFESISHHPQVNRHEGMRILDEGFVADLIIQHFNMVMQMDVK